VKRVRLLLVLV